MRIKLHIIIGILMLLLASCGQQHDAESTVKDFMTKNLTDNSKLSDVRFASIDSTRHINDSIRNVMKHTIQKDYKIFNTDIPYTEAKSDETLISCRVNCKINEKPYRGVFYLSKNTMGVVAFIFHEDLGEED